jgi:signal transduction histidine kinase
LDKKVKVKITVIEKEDLINIELSDNGNGVEEKELPNLFVSFYRGDISRTNPSQGSGLGLAIAKNIVEAHRGKIHAYNMNGLAIKITLPIILEK